MLAYVYLEDKKLKLTEKPVPELLGEDAIIKVNACSICGTDVRTYRFGSSKIDKGRIIGHEVVGEIVELSSDAHGDFKVGDKVAVAPALGCGECNYCKSGHTNMCDNLKTIGYQFDGGFAQYMRIPGLAFKMGNVYRLPEVRDISIYTLSEPLACVINAQSYLKISQDDNVVIFGSGIIGCMHAEMAMVAGAKKVIIVESSAERIDQANKLIEKVLFINPNETDAGQEILRLSQGRGADVVIVACSVGQAQEAGMNMLAKRGRISIFGGLPGESKGYIDSNLIHYREISVFGAHASTPGQNKAAMEMIYRRDINVEKYITKRYKLEEIEQAFIEIEEGKILKAVIENN